MKTNEKVNSKMLLKETFSIMKLLKAKAIDVDEAKAQSHLLKQANNLLKYELDRVKVMMKISDFNKNNDSKVDLRDIEEY